MKSWKRAKAHTPFLLGACVIALFYVWRIRYGNAEVDEAFYLTIPFRLLKGDCLLTDEWHVSQLTGFLQAPVMGLQRLLFGSTEGVVLHFRACWAVGHLAVMTLSYVLLARRSRPGAAAAAFIYGLSVPFGLMTPSYYSMGAAAAYLLAVLFFMGDCTAAADVSKGILLAVLVLCNPFCLAIYAGLMVLAAVNGFARFDEQLAWRHVAQWHLGILLLLIPFALHVASGAQSVEHLLENLRGILQDTAHSSSGFLGRSRNSLRMLLRENPQFFRALGIFFLIALPVKRIRPLMAGMIALLCAYYALRDARYFMYVWDGNSLTMFLMCGAAALFVLWEKRSCRMLAYALMLPFAYALMVNMSSNQGPRAMLVGTIPGACMGAVLFAEYAKAHPISLHLGKWRVSGLACMLAAALAAQLCAQGYVRAKQVFWEYVEPAELTERIGHGPLKGIYTQPEKAEEYEHLCGVLESLGDLSDKKVMCFEFVSMAFLIADCEIGAPSAWMEFSDLDDPRLYEYFHLNPDNWPDIIFVDRRYAVEWTPAQYESYARRNGYEIIRYDDRYTVMRRTDEGARAAAIQEI